jgi:transposase
MEFFDHFVKVSHLLKSDYWGCFGKLRQPLKTSYFGGFVTHSIFDKKDSMANKVKSMLQIRRILQLLEESRSKRFISREVGVSRNTVDYYEKRVKVSGLTLSQLLLLKDGELSQFIYNTSTTQVSNLRQSEFDSKLDYHLKELTRPGVTRQLLWQEYIVRYPNGYAYTQFCERLKQGKRLNGVVMHLEHSPGERMEVDFAGKKLSYIDSIGKTKVECPVLVCVLPSSGLTYVEALIDASQEQVYNCLSRVLRYFGGVPQSILSDNMRQYVIKSNRYEPTFNELAEQWSVHYNTTLTATRVVKPRDKASVEKHVHISYLRIFALLRNTVFSSLTELNLGVFDCLEKHNNTLMQHTKISRWERFLTQEKHTLKPLPPTDFIYRKRISAKVQMNYHVILGEDMHQYSVPYNYVGKQVMIVYDHYEVEVFLDMQRIALHTRNYRRNAYSTKEEHMPEKHLHYKETKGWDADYFLSQGMKVGLNTQAVMARLLAKNKFAEQTYNACLGILSLGRKYGNERLESACRLAVSVPSTNYQMVSNILKNNRDKENQSEITPILPRHENIRGKEAYQ